jgi:hypothetical protein
MATAQEPAGIRGPHGVKDVGERGSNFHKHLILADQNCDFKQQYRN